MMKIILGVDAGLSATKVVGPKGVVSFPSLTKKQPRKKKDFTGPFDIPEEQKFELTYNSREYLLGEHATFTEQWSASHSDSHDGTGSKNDETAFIRAIGGVCLYMDHFEKFEDEEVDVYLAYGSPIISAVNAGEVNEIEERFKNDNKPIEITYNGFELRLNFKEILVLPEGAAAFFSEEFTAKHVFILDAGSQTINLAALQNGRPIPNATDTMPFGVEYYIEGNGEEFAAEELMDDVYKKIISLRWPKKSTIHVCGGYATQILQAFKEGYADKNVYAMELIRPELTMPRKSKPLEPIYANAAGLYFIAKEAFTAALKG